MGQRTPRKRQALRVAAEALRRELDAEIDRLAVLPEATPEMVLKAFQTHLARRLPEIASASGLDVESLRRAVLRSGRRQWSFLHERLRRQPVRCVHVAPPLPRYLARVAQRFLDALDLGAIPCHLVPWDGPITDVKGTVSELRREGRRYVELDPAPPNMEPWQMSDPAALEEQLERTRGLPPRREYVEAVRQHDFDLIVVRLNRKSLRRDARTPCAKCPDVPLHSVLEHTLVHELVHVAHPEQSYDNPWTDARVAQLIAEHGG
jgi:hypothetical protein